jgi:hypothetical protein
VVILVAIVYVALSACVESKPTSAPLSEPTVYEWIGPGATPSVTRLAQDKAACFQEGEQKESVSTGDRLQTHVNLCMRTKGWGQKAVD